MSHGIVRDRLSSYPDSMTLIDTHALPADPLEALRELAACDDELDRLRRIAVEEARERGASWEQVGAALGMSRQAAWEFYTRQIRDDLASAASASDLSEADAMDLAVSEAELLERKLTADRTRHEADSELRESLGSDFSKAYIALKHAEWDSYCAHFSAWEHANTLDV